ncbi:MAG: AAA family ATPase [Rhodospirillaceae bacterium]
MLPALRGTDPVQFVGKEVPPRRWVVDGWIPEGEVHMLSGDGGVGKSLLAQQLMTCAAVGRNWLGMTTRPCRAVGIFCEDRDEELHRRQDGINRMLDIDFSALENMQWICRKGEDNELMQYPNGWDKGAPVPFFQQVHNFCQDFGAELIVLDSLHDLFSGNENDRQQTRQFVNLLAGLASDHHGAVVLCAHPSRDGMASGSGYSGSTAWHNTVRSRAYLTRPAEGEDADPDSRVLKNMKANYGAMGGTVNIAYREGAFVVVEKPTGVFKAIQDRKAEKVFMDLLRNSLARGVRLSANKRANNWAPRDMEKPALTEGVRLTELALAMDRLLARREVVVGEVRFPGEVRAGLGLRPVQADDSQP